MCRIIIGVWALFAGGLATLAGLGGLVYYVLTRAPAPAGEYPNALFAVCGGLFWLGVGIWLLWGGRNHDARAESSQQSPVSSLSQEQIDKELAKVEQWLRANKGNEQITLGLLKEKYELLIGRIDILQLDNTDKAIEVAEEIQYLKPPHYPYRALGLSLGGLAYYIKAQISLDLERFGGYGNRVESINRALDRYKRSLAIDPNNAETLARKAAAEWLGGYKADAKRSIKQAKAINPKNPVVQAIEERMTAGRDEKLFEAGATGVVLLGSATVLGGLGLAGAFLDSLNRDNQNNW